MVGPARVRPGRSIHVRQSISSARARAASLLVRASGQAARVCVRVRVRAVSGGPEAVCRFGVDSVERVARLTEMRPGPGFQPRRLALRRARQAPRWASPGDSMRFIPPARRPTRPARPPKVHRDRPAGPGPPPLGHRPGPARRPEIGPGSSESGPLTEKGDLPGPCRPGWTAPNGSNGPNGWRTGGVVLARVAPGPVS